MLTLPESSLDWRLLPAVEKGKNYQIIVGTSDTLCLLLFAFQATFPLLPLRSNFDWVIQASPTPQFCPYYTFRLCVVGACQTHLLRSQAPFQPIYWPPVFHLSAFIATMRGVSIKKSYNHHSLAVFHIFNQGRSINFVLADGGVVFPNYQNITYYIMKSVDLKGHL